MSTIEVDVVALGYCTITIPEGFRPKEDTIILVSGYGIYNNIMVSVPVWEYWTVKQDGTIVSNDIPENTIIAAGTQIINAGW